MPPTDEHSSHIVYFNGGHRSGLAALEVARRHGTGNLVLLTPRLPESVENIDVRRFRADVAWHLKVPLTYLSSGTQDQFDVALSRLRPGRRLQCVEGLKREPLRAWLEQHADPTTDVVYFGLGERTRIQRRACSVGLWGFRTDYPLALWQRSFESTKDVGITPPQQDTRCVGCLRAGRPHWFEVFQKRPDVWGKASRLEDQTDETILRDTFLEEVAAEFHEKHRRGEALEGDDGRLPCECTT